MSGAGDREAAALADEQRRVRELRTTVDLACAVLSQASTSRGEAEELVATTRRRALRLFPDKGHVFDLILAPRLRRILDEAWPPADVLSFPEGRATSQDGRQTKSDITPSTSKKMK